MTDCKHERIIKIGAKANDCQFAYVPHLDLRHDGYALDIDNVCGGDYINLSICLDCGHVIGFTPLTDEEVKEVFTESC